MSKKPEISSGFNPSREYAERRTTDWKFGEIVLSGITDKVAGLVIAVFAWPNPVAGIYPRVEYAFNHVVTFFQQKLREFFPAGETQTGREDFKDCVSRGHNNEIEKQLNYAIINKLLTPTTTKWLEEKGYFTAEGIKLADRFPAMMSNTTRNGNSIKGPIEAIKKYGCLPKSLLPVRADMTFDEYHNKKDITQEMLDLGQEWKKRISVNYIVVGQRDFLKFAGDIRWEIFDSYTDPVDGDYVKRLASDYNIFPNGYQIVINETDFKPPVINLKKNTLKTIKFATDTRVFIVSNANPKNLYWLGDPDGSAWEDYKLLLAEGLIAPFETISDALYDGYDIQAGLVKVDFIDTGATNTKGLWTKLVNIFK